MTIFYSKSTNGFYDDSIHGGNMPDDCVEVDIDQYNSLMQDQESGGRIAPDEAGHPVIHQVKPTNDEKIAAYRAAVGVHIDQKAQSFGFDSIVTAVTYADEPADPLNQNYGKALRAWRSQCWEKCREVLATWQGGGAEPTVEDLIASLPAFVAP